MPKKILIAEDDAEILKMFTDMLQTAGFDVISAVDGEQALELLEQHTPDLVLLDIRMPKKDGFEVLETLQAANKIDGMKVVILSNVENEEWAKRAKSLGAHDYWLKIDTHLIDLIDKIKVLLGE